MKKRYTIAVLSVLLLGACASGPQSRSPSEVDYEYVNAVERHADSAGVDVQWVNPPTRKREPEDQG